MKKQKAFIPLEIKITNGAGKGFLMGFTLIELLVVIAIIALLMAIFMPTMSRARKQTKTIACQSILRQWSKVFAMYTMNNDGYFFSGNTGKMWTKILAPYTEDLKLRLCPMATKPASEVMGILNVPGSKFLAWGRYDPNLADFGIEKDKDIYGSYGMNGNVSNDPPGTIDIYGRNLDNNWRSCNVKGANNIPLFLDCASLGGIPNQSDMPPQYDGDLGVGYPPDMKFFCIDRHNGFINGLFLDFSVRKVGLKQLWKVKWHRQFDINADPPVWPDWMKSFKDY